MEQLGGGGMDAVSANESRLSWAVSVRAYVCAWVKDSGANFNQMCCAGSRGPRLIASRERASGQRASCVLCCRDTVQLRSM